jgi:translation initiation factor 6|tara:strand:+ start:639 stop:1304 length:666 start_codon:yes stop_codon:yes gene_type:complete
MDIIKYDIYSGPNIGIYSTVNDEFVFLPRGFSDGKSEKLSEYLEVKSLEISVANARVLGILMVVNNHGILLPSTCSEGEFNHIKDNTDLNVEILDVKNNALGNMMSVNDKGGIVSPLIPKEDLQKIQDALDIEVMQFKIAGFQQIGAVMATSEKGTVVHPETDEEDMKTINNLLGGNIEAATINGGIPFVSSGILANKNSVVVGSLTNGPEIMMLTRAFLH